MPDKPAPGVTVPEKKRSEPAAARPASRWGQLGLHALRISLFLCTLLLIHVQHGEFLQDLKEGPQYVLQLPDFAALPNVAAIADSPAQDGSQALFAESEEQIGYALQTSPAGDSVIGFSGPTNVLLAFDDDDQLMTLGVLSSGDTREHVHTIEQDELFFSSMIGASRDELATLEVDAVSGATLTCMAIRESIALRLGKTRSSTSLRFPDPPALAQIQTIRTEVKEIVADEDLQATWWLLDEGQQRIAKLVRTVPIADQVIGYQGPSETWMLFGLKGELSEVSVQGSFDNEPYVSYVREDDFFASLFTGKSLEELSAVDAAEAQIEGVSGATMTSLAVSDALFLTAKKHQEEVELLSSRKAKPLLSWSLRDYGTGVVVLFALAVGLTRLKARKKLRLALQVVVVAYLGLVNGDMLSQAMLAGWSKVGIPWQTAGGLLMLTAAALFLPIFSGHNVYCSHICPHGALQNLTRNRLPWRIRLGRKTTKFLKAVPALLLVWCVVVAMSGLSFSLVDIEPFDAWVFRVAGWSTIVVALVGLAASFFIPMAYCRFGCPTGLLLGFLRFHSKRNRWSQSDWIASALVALAFGVWILF
ncbi:MAG: FMN-binding protein [Planctomycetota bacterium]